MDVHSEILKTVRSTREMLLPHWGNIDGSNKDASAHSVVTELDLSIERYLHDELKKIDPGAEFAGEEFGGTREAERFWLCDPIDGTAHFVRGLPFCSVMLALIEGGSVNFTAIYDFVNDDMYHAARGEGAYKNDSPIHVSERPIEQAYVALETRTDKPVNHEVARKLRKTSVLFNTITAGYEFALVASGKLEARICLDPWGKDWDFAPGSLLVSEAGGIVANIGSSSYDFRELDFIAANPAVYRALTNERDGLFPIRQ